MIVRELRTMLEQVDPELEIRLEYHPCEPGEDRTKPVREVRKRDYVAVVINQLPRPAPPVVSRGGGGARIVGGRK